MRRLHDSNDVICLQETHGKIEFLQALLVIRSFTKVKAFVNDQVNTGGSPTIIRKTLLYDDTMVTHVTTQIGRDHFVKIHSATRFLMIANVHLETCFEPEKSQRTVA